MSAVDEARAGRSAPAASSAASSVMAWSVPIAVLVTLTSVLGLVDARVYAEETDNWATQARGQDLGNLVAVAVLLAAGAACSRGSRRAALVWLGTLLYLVYAFVVYAMAVHFNALFLAYVAVLGLSSYAVMLTVDALRAETEALPQPTARRVAGWTSLAIGVLFGLLWLSELIPATFSGEAPESVREAGLWVNPIHVIDLAVLLPAFVVAGILTLRGRAAGRFFVGPLLVFSVLMGSSIVAAMALTVADGSTDAVAPLVLVGLVVAASLYAAWRHLSSGYDRSELPVTGDAGDLKCGRV